MTRGIQSSELALFLPHTAATKGSNLQYPKEKPKKPLIQPACYNSWSTVLSKLC